MACHTNTIGQQQTIKISDLNKRTHLLSTYMLCRRLYTRSGMAVHPQTGQPGNRRRENNGMKFLV